MASVESTITPSISNRMPLNVWISARLVKAPWGSESVPTMMRLILNRDNCRKKREAIKFTRGDRIGSYDLYRVFRTIPGQRVIAAETIPLLVW